MFPDTIILAGGFGTRLQSVVTDVPKPMAPVAGKPFLEWLLTYMEQFQPSKIILSTGFKHQVIESYFGNVFNSIPLQYCIEDEPLGTGGAIKRAVSMVDTSDCLVLNGDTFFQLDHSKFFEFHRHTNSLFGMALKPMDKPSRYGTVEQEENTILAFHEKNPDLGHGLINTGVYLMSKQLLGHFPEQEKFSFEKDFLEINPTKLPMKCYTSDDYFIDIGIPEDYYKANDEFPFLFN